MNKEEATNYWVVYTNFTKRAEEYFTGRFWWLAAYITLFLVLWSFVGLPLVAKTLSGMLLLNLGIMLWFLRKSFFESMREMKLVFLIYAVVNVVLAFGLIASAFLSNPA